MLSKESLKRLTIQELEGQLVQVKATFRETSSLLAIERQQQLAKAKQIKGKSNKRKKQLIEQILKIQKETQRVQAKIEQINMQSKIRLDMSSPAIKPLSIDTGKIKVRSTKPQREEGMNNAEMWAAIKTYKDNVKRGVIKERNEYEKLHSEEQAEYAYEVMDDKDYEKYVKLANEKAEKLERDSFERAEKFKSGEYFGEMWPGF